MRLFLAIWMVMLSIGLHPALGAPGESWTNLLRQAGNTEDELTRLRLVRGLEKAREVPVHVRADLQKLSPVIACWADGRHHVSIDTNRAAENGYLCGFFASKVKHPPARGMYPPEVSEASPVYPLWCLYRGRMLIWQVIQSGPLLRVRESREAYFGEARRLLQVARQAFPENRIIGMYLGQPISWPSIAPDPQAPDWANLQRDALEKLAEIIHWWIRERQLPDGQFGGGWGDDVEMWRWWIPILLGFYDPELNAAQERLSTGIFQLPHLKSGFTSRVTDVEHSNEDTTDTILPMMHLQPEDSVWRARALRPVELMRSLWTGRNERGFLQFKSIYFSVDRVDLSSERAFDTVYHPSIVQPALLYWQRTGDPEVEKLMADWLRVWVDAAARAENGKPAGVLPSAIRWPAGVCGAPGRPWYEPFSPGHNDALYNWPGATVLMTSTLLLAAHRTGNNSFLEPVKSMAAIRARHLRQRPSTAPDLGTEAWAAARMQGFLGDTLAKYRFLTGDTQFDELLREDAPAYMHYRLSSQPKRMLNALRKTTLAFQSNREAYTSEMRWTDRVLSFTRNFLQYLPEPAPPSPDMEILYNTVTGDPGNPLILPLNAVRWMTSPHQIAVLVTNSGPESLAAELFHFGNNPRPMEAELYLLRPGTYQWTLHQAGQKEFGRERLQVTGPRARIRFELPPRQPCVLAIQKL